MALSKGGKILKYQKLQSLTSRIFAPFEAIVAHQTLARAVAMPVAHDSPLPLPHHLS